MCLWGKVLGLLLGMEGEVLGWDCGYGLSTMGVKKGAFWTVLGGPLCP